MREAEGSPVDAPILIFDDTLLFGGHEAMFLRLVPGLQAAFPAARLVFCLSERNDRLAAAIRGIRIPDMDIVRLPFAKVRGEPFRAPFRRRYRACLRDLIRQFAPQLAILVQGRIEATLAPLLEARACGVPTASYLPMAHPVVQMEGRTVVNRMRDLSRLPYYRASDLYIVPTRTAAAHLRRAGVRVPVHVVPNVIAPVPQVADRMLARSRQSLPSGRKLALFMGRMDRHQKGLDLLLDRIAGWTMPDWDFVAVGDGPDAGWFDAVVADRGISHRVIRRGWTDAPGDFYAACDLVLLPSRFEGAPLVVFETLAYGRPMVVSPIEEHAELVPPRALADFGDQHEVEAAVADVSKNGEAIFARAFTEAGQWQDISHSQARFGDALLQAAGNGDRIRRDGRRPGVA